MAGGAVIAVAVGAAALVGLPEPPQSVTVADGVNDDGIDDAADFADDRSESTTRSTTSGPEVESDQDAPVTAPADPAPLATTATTEAAETSQVTESESTTSSNSGAETDPPAPGPETPDSIVAPNPRPTPGLKTTVTTTSRWDAGYCFQIDLLNDTTEAQAWSLPIEVVGTVATIWNAVVIENEAGTSVFAGEEGHNTTIGPGALTTFGACIDTE